MNINFEYYRIFYYVAKYNNFTKAARALGSSQPNVTRAMNCLESEAGCTLLVRTNRGVHLTPEGERLYVRVAAAMQQLQLAEDELTESAGLEHGIVTIGASETALSIYLLEQLKRFRIEYPGIQIRLQNYSTPQAVKAVKNGEVDFAVVTTPVTISEPLKKTELQSFQEVLVCGKTFQALGNRKLRLAEVQNYPFICLGKETTTYQFYQQIFASYGLTLKPDTEAATTDQILLLVKHELGLAFLPEPMIRQAAARQEIIPLSVQEVIPERKVCVVYDARRPMSGAAQRLKKMLPEEATEKIFQ